MLYFPAESEPDLEFIAVIHAVISVLLNVCFLFLCSMFLNVTSYNMMVGLTGRWYVWQLFNVSVILSASRRDGHSLSHRAVCSMFYVCSVFCSALSPYLQYPTLVILHTTALILIIYTFTSKKEFLLVSSTLYNQANCWR